jgi:pilus assembly protein CpaB
LKRSNRLILLIGVFLAIVAFVGILVVFRQPSTNTNGGPTAVNEPTVIAATDIALGQEITEPMLSVTDLPPTARNAGAFGATSQVVGEIARQPITKGQQVTSVHTSSGAASADIAQLIPVGFTAVAVQVDQVSGVGTLINPGDRVDMVVGFTGDKFPVISVDPSADNQITVVSGLNNTSVKVLLSGMQVLTTIRQAPTTQQQQAQAEQQQTGDQPPPTLTGESLIVVVAALPQQAEVIKFAQLDGSVSLVLRSPDDFIDPNTGEPLEFVAPAETTGITLKVLVDTYDVLVPQLVETLLPAVNNR